jgi:hypothetical protein
MTSPGPQSALIVEIPEAEPAVGELRDRLDANARLGVPAHVTVVSPFAPPEIIDAAARRQLSELFGSTPSFGVCLDRTGWFGQDVLWLGPADPAPFRALTERVVAEFPAYPPFEGRFDEVIPHLTVGHSWPAGELRSAEEAVRAGLPMGSTVRAVTLLASGPDGRWGRRARFSLGW